MITRPALISHGADVIWPLTDDPLTAATLLPSGSEQQTEIPVRVAETRPRSGHFAQRFHLR